MKSMPVISKRTRKRILSYVMDFIHSYGLKWNDDFPSEIANVYVSIIENTHKLPNTRLFLAKARKIKTTFFKLNYIKKSEFLKEILQALNKKFKNIFEELEKEKVAPGIEAKKEAVVKINIVEKANYEFITVDDIDSFREVRKIDKNLVEKIVPLDLEEDKIGYYLAEIIGDEYSHKHWGGEKSDFFTTRLVIKGKRVPAAFLLKGRGTKGKLTIKKCGKNGNQILNLLDEPAEVYIVQYVGEIDSDVVKLLEKLVAEKSRKGKKLYYCIMDGIDTARVLVAYNKLTISS